MYSLKMVYFLTLNNDKKLMSACGNVFVENKCMCTHLSFNNSCKTKPRKIKTKMLMSYFWMVRFIRWFPTLSLLLCKTAYICTVQQEYNMNHISNFKFPSSHI